MGNVCNRCEICSGQSDTGAGVCSRIAVFPSYVPFRKCCSTRVSCRSVTIVPVLVAVPRVWISSHTYKYPPTKYLNPKFNPIKSQNSISWNVPLPTLSVDLYYLISVMAQRCWWNVSCFLIWRRVIGIVVTDVSVSRSTFVFKVKLTEKTELICAEYEDIRVIRNAENCTPTDTALRAVKLNIQDSINLAVAPHGAEWRFSYVIAQWFCQSSKHCTEAGVREKRNWGKYVLILGLVRVWMCKYIRTRL